jgi:hypothetical protein
MGITEVGYENLFHPFTNPHRRNEPLVFYIGRNWMIDTDICSQ